MAESTVKCAAATSAEEAGAMTQHRPNLKTWAKDWQNPAQLPARDQYCHYHIAINGICVPHEVQLLHNISICECAGQGKHYG